MVRTGDELDGRYRLIAEIGAGTFGVVYRGRDLETRGEVAIKVMKQVADPSQAKRFEREAVALARLRGTAAIFVHAFGKTREGAPYIVMELLTGRDLESFVAEAEAQGGRLKPAKMLELLRPVAKTLAKAHEHGILHRDLKPSNVFVLDAAAGGGVRLLDFGLAKLIGVESLTSTGMVAGTPSYIAPEAWRGEKGLDRRVDVYSLGVLVFRCLSGQVPFPTSSMIDLCRWATSGDRPSLCALRGGLPASLDSWVQKALAVDPEDRFQSIDSLWSALESILASGAAPPY
ncbi:MAG: serine/threonine protein kinase [Myxococcales bacterium]|nr:serine/threonine protein kinase [Myxococcales bacterium]